MSKMTKKEAELAGLLCEGLEGFLPELKMAADRAKELLERHGWESNYWDYAEAYMNLANEYFGIRKALKENGVELEAE